MDMNLKSTPFLALFVVLGAVGITTAYAAGTIILDGDVIVVDSLTVDTDSLVVDSTNDRVGIGTTTPTSKLHVVGDLTLQSNVICTDCIDSADILDETILSDDLSPTLRALLGIAAQDETCPNINSLGFVYTGVVTGLVDPSNNLGSGIGVGDIIRGFYCYDPNTPDTAPGPSAIYNLEFYSIVIGIHNFSCSSTNNNILINNDGLFGDGYDLICSGMTSSLYSSFTDNFGFINLRDSEGTVFVDVSLPQSAPDLNEFEQKTFRFEFDDGVFLGRVDGSLTSLVQAQ